MLLSGDEIRDIQQKRAEQFARLRWTRNRMGRNAAGLSYQNHKQPLASKQDSPLYSSYLVDRKNRQIMQRQIRATLQAESAKFYQQLQHWHEARSQIIKKSKLRSPERKLEWKKLANERQAFIQQFKKKQAQQREAIPKLLDWPQFLKQQALKGDELAVGLNTAGSDTLGKRNNSPLCGPRDDHLSRVSTVCFCDLLDKLILQDRASRRSERRVGLHHDTLALAEFDQVMLSGPSTGDSASTSSFPDSLFIPPQSQRKKLPSLVNAM